MPVGVVTLGQVAGRLQVLEVACNRSTDAVGCRWLGCWPSVGG